MRFIDYEETDLAAEEVLEESAVLEPFRCEIEELSFTRLNLTVRLTRLERREVRMHCDRVDTLCRELVLLVLHERNQRAHHDGQSGKQKRGKLIYEGLPATCRHHDKSVTTFEERFDRIPLATPEIGMTEPVHQHGAGGLLCNWLLHTSFPTGRNYSRATGASNGVYSALTTSREALVRKNNISGFYRMIL